MSKLFKLISSAYILTAQTGANAHPAFTGYHDTTERDLSNWKYDSPVFRDGQGSKPIQKKLNRLPDLTSFKKYYEFGHDYLKFSTPLYGATTPGSKNVRSELRYNHDFLRSTGKSFLRQTIKITKVVPDIKFVIGQIHTTNQYGISKDFKCPIHIVIRYNPTIQRLQIRDLDVTTKLCRSKWRNYPGKFKVGQEFTQQIRTEDGKLYFQAGKKPEVLVQDYNYLATEYGGAFDPGYYKFGVYLQGSCGGSGKPEDCKRGDAGPDDLTTVQVKGMEIGLTDFHTKKWVTSKLDFNDPQSLVQTHEDLQSSARTPRHQQETADLQSLADTDAEANLDTEADWGDQSLARQHCKGQKLKKVCMRIFINKKRAARRAKWAKKAKK